MVTAGIDCSVKNTKIVQNFVGRGKKITGFRKERGWNNFHRQAHGFGSRSEPR